MNKNPSEWRVTSNPVAGMMLYGVYRLRDKDEVDHSGNREMRGGWYDRRHDAERLAETLNNDGDTLNVIIKKPGHMPQELEIDYSLEALQSLVGGLIEHVNINEQIGMLINEEGKLNGMEENFPFRGDYIVGPAVFVGYGGEDFADVPACLADIRAIIREEAEECDRP